MLLAGMNIKELVAFKSRLNDNLDMKYLGDGSHILGMPIVWDRDKKLLYLSQEEYDKVLLRFNMDKGKALSAPLSSYVKLRKLDCP